ncbi:putative sensor histidine kinase [Sterolibacterium denitrificans]|uniref:histidine kinase n=1 Tax=Sterolibacterium denitrificans TaxID=157592 RepID=A0A7Z7HT30_9PROT|nr:HAMP domain-containing sensor histidine kinase [Sterolibacterium denitrificans]SMB26515.1 putative sensor histidine kinase [Sterolibacterium denitrificans]
MDSLVAAAIHDAKNSLNALGTWLARARHEFATQAQGADSPALRQAENLASLLGGQLVELLVLYRAGEGSLRMAIEDHSLADFVADVMTEFAVAGSDAGKIRIETDFSAAECIGTWAFDAYLVKLVLLDALRNALRHASRTIRFSVGQLGEEGIRFTVKDDGEGYPDEALRAVEAETDAADEIDRSAAANESVSKHGGTGLGLRFARLIASRHAVPASQSGRPGRQGRLELVNDGLGSGARGARFTLILP